jgi:hypothetical protein
VEGEEERAERANRVLCGGFSFSCFSVNSIPTSPKSKITELGFINIIQVGVTVCCDVDDTFETNSCTILISNQNCHAGHTTN